MRYVFRKTTALLLTLCMIVGMTGLPITAYAEGLDSGDGDAAIVAADKAALGIGFSVTDSVYGVTDDLTLPLTGVSGSAITWLSDAPEIIVNDGAVTRPDANAEDTEVTLTATITYGEASDTRDFVVTVLKETAPLPGDEAEDDEIIPEIGAPHAGENDAEEFLSMGDAAPASEEPPDLEMVAHTATTITMTVIDGAEYQAWDNVSGTIIPWQDSNVITGLVPNRSYLIWARWKETSITFSSRVVKTDKATLGGSVYINGSYVFGQTLTADISLLTIDPAGAAFGTLYYQWMRAGTDIAYATGSTYTLTAADIGQKIKVKVMAENCHGEISSLTDFFTVEKAPQAKPPVPSAASKTATSISLTATEGAEYRKGGTNDWQDSPIFTGLTPGSSNMFYIRMKETATHKVSEQSYGLITTDKVTLVGTVSVSGSHVYGQTLTAVMGTFSTDPAGYDTGEISYQWTRDGADIAGAAGTAYTLTAEDVGKVINIRVTAANCQSPIASDNTSAVAKATWWYTLEPPILNFAEDTSITLAEITGAEYKCGEGEWQDSPTFTGLTPNTEYTFYARMKETATHYATASSGPRVLQTLKASQPAPDPPTVSLVSATDVKFIQLPDVQYRMEGGAWRDIGSFNGLQPNTTYTFYMRMKETTTHQVSPPSSPVTVTTLKRQQLLPPAAPTLHSKTATSITLNVIANAEYSINGTDWQDSPVFSGLTPDTGYTFYARLKESSEYYASPPSDPSDLFTTDKAALSGSVSISGSHVFGQTLTAVTSALIIDPADAVIGTLSYQWMRDGAEITGATESTYTLVAADVGKVINVKVSSEYCTGEAISANMSVVARAEQAAPAAPTAVSVTAIGVTLTAIPGAQYRLGTGDWQESPEFTGLTPGTEYTFYARLKESSTLQASPASAPATVTMLKHEQSPPAAPTLHSKTATSITLNVIANAEYSINGTDWQDSPVFSGLAPNTGYTFYARLKETSEYYASPSSAASDALTTDKAALSGSVSLSGTHAFGQTLTAVTDTLSTDPAGVDTGALSYQWTRDGAEIGGAAADTYTLAAEDIGAVVNVTVTAEHCTGAVSSANSNPVTKAASPAPTVEVSGKTTISVMLEAIPGAQYFCGTTALTPEKTADGWQTSTEFTGLSPNTTYYFFAYLEETGTHLASPVSAGAAATTEKAPMTGTVSIAGTLKYGETLTVNITGITGTFTCTWYRSGDSVPIDVGMSHLIGMTDVGKTITVQVTEADHDGFITDTTGMIAKADGPAAPTGGVIDDTADTFGFTPVPGHAEAALYEYSTDGGASWTNVTENPFSVGDTAIAAGALQVRLKETYTHLAGEVLTSTAAFTENLTGSVSISGSAVYGEALTATVTGTQGDASPVYTWYRSGESASIRTGSTYQTVQADIGRTLRVEATAAGYGGKLVSADTAVVAKAVQAPPTLAYTRSGDYETDGVTVTITSPASGAAYSFDGSTYGATNSHTYAQGVTGATIYARLEETATHLQSAAASLVLDFTKQNQAAPIVTLSATAGEAAVILHISASGGQSGSYAYKIGGGSYADLPADGNVALTMAGETVVVSVRDKGDAYYNPSPDAPQTIALPKYLNFATVTVSAANFTKTQTGITMSAAPVSSNGGDMEYSFDGGAYVALDTNDLPAFTGLAAGSSHTVSLRVKGDAQREAGAPASVTIQTLPGGSTGGGNGGDDTSESPKPAVTIEKQPNMPVTAKISVAGTVKDGILSATITEQMVKDAISAAQESAKKSGKTADGIAVEFGITNSGIYTSMSAAIDAQAIDQLKESGVKFIKIGSAVLDVTLDTGAIVETDRQSTGTVTVSARVQTKLSKAAKALIGSRPVFDITVSYQKGGKTGYVTSFGKGAVTLGIAYKAPDKEKTGSLFGVFVDKTGKPQPLTNSSYVGGRVIFSRNSLSTYGVGYTPPVPAFTDITKHWAKENIDFVASRGLISGTSATTFAPNTAITRADFLMALGRLSSADMSIYKTSSFIDVKTSDPAMPYIEWAVKNKIVQGIGGGKFGPARSISRQDMAVMMQNYVTATGYRLPVSLAAVTFSDSAKIAAYAKEAVTAIQQAGVMQGKGNNAFDPQGNATRAEASTILRRFVELVIDEGTARG